MNQTLLAIILAIFASGGFWTALQTWLTGISKTKTSEQKLLLGIAFRQIIELCDFYIKRGFVSTEEYKELNKYLFEPYRDLGGDGTAEKMIKEVERLPIKKEGGAGYD